MRFFDFPKWLLACVLLMLLPGAPVFGQADPAPKSAVGPLLKLLRFARATGVCGGCQRLEWSV